MKRLLNSEGVWENGFSLIRMITGLLLIYHGSETVVSEQMKGYGQWLTDLHVPFPYFMAYLGKGSELVMGFCLTVGLFTRVATVFLILTFTFVTFVMGHGKFLMEDQHPFLFILLNFVFLFAGPGKWSLDHLFSRTDR